MVDLAPYMRMAIDEAKISLREGNCGFGAAIIKDGQLIAKARDAEKTAHDATAHAEIAAIRTASAQLGRDLSGCIIVSTLEACDILGLDTRFVCRHLSEKPTTDLLRQIHPGLRFTRNYEKLRPHTPYCEEMILLDAGRGQT